MQILTGASSIHTCLKKLILKATAIEAATAWASVGFKACDLLFKHKQKIRRLIVGMHFYQTHPNFIEAYLSKKAVKFIMSTDGTFHPKTYFFAMPGSEWKCLVGSANFTRSAMKSNQEMAVLIESHDPGAAQLKKEILDSIETWWTMAKYMDRNRLEYYREQWEKNRVKNTRRAGTFGKVTASEVDSDRGAAAIDIPIIRMNWKDFFKRVMSERDERNQRTINIRLSVLKQVSTFFKDHRHFQEMPKETRYKVAGILPSKSSDFAWFGSMFGAGRFKGAVNRNDRHLSQALDRIPLKGKLDRVDYMAFIMTFKKAFPNGRNCLGTATRLLAMKRPEVFVCLDSKNRKQLCKAFAISQDVDYELYWDSIVKRIQASSWWNTKRPISNPERSVWEGRAAFLDALFYEPK